jgi:hypothetical protein
MARILLYVLLVLLVLVATASVLMQDSATSVAPEEFVFTFSEDLEAILGRDQRQIEEFLANPVLIELVRQANSENAGLSDRDIAALDDQWQKAEGEALVNAVLTNEIADHLVLFQEKNPRYSEIFVTDRRGLNIGQTNKTSDYFQADESWWMESYNGGMGKSFHGPIEFDESSQTEAISLYAPIRDGDTVLGVVKAVVNVAAIKVEL